MSHIEAVIFDADGVVINFTSWYSERFAKMQGISLDLVRPFFEHEFQACLKGEADLKEAIQPYLKTWKWDKSVDALVQHWHESENRPNTELLVEIARLKQRGIKCYLATNQEKYRAHYIAGKIGFLTLFDHCFFSYEMHTVKPELKFYEYIWESIQYMDLIDEKSMVMFWDDQQKNVDVAKEFGFEASVYAGSNSVLKELLVL